MWWHLLWTGLFFGNFRPKVDFYTLNILHYRWKYQSFHKNLKNIMPQDGSLTPENLASLMAAYFFVKFRKFLVRNSVIYDIIRLYHLS